jgi:hypothetical protein
MLMAETELRGVLPYLISPVTDTGEINAIDFPAGREIKNAVVRAVEEDRTSFGA